MHPPKHHVSYHLTPTKTPKNQNKTLAKSPTQSIPPTLQIQPTDIHPLLRELAIQLRPRPVRILVLRPRIALLRPLHVVLRPGQLGVREADVGDVVEIRCRVEARLRVVQQADAADQGGV